MIKYELFININKEIRYCLNSNAYNQGKRWDIYVRYYSYLIYLCIIVLGKWSVASLIIPYPLMI